MSELCLDVSLKDLPYMDKVLVASEVTKLRKFGSSLTLGKLDTDAKVVSMLSMFSSRNLKILELCLILVSASVI